MLDKDYYAWRWTIIIMRCSTHCQDCSKDGGLDRFSPIRGLRFLKAIGINKDVIAKYFTNTVSRIGGIGLDDIAKEVNFLHSQAFDRWIWESIYLWTAQAVINSAAARKNIFTTRIRSIFFRNPPAAVIIKCLKNTVRRSMMSPAR